ncbi:ABC transporter ATP-binding protein [Vallitalea okinawensis]|uniref:ABC transporter ATP-binding protein n=1 Tax=Vallitalea okinawensis TaxID=2078660 RepID=UPI000CFC1A27|nr:ABC transporter ATP-binding protein [Vallitalea okinawensis]
MVQVNNLTKIYKSNKKNKTNEILATNNLSFQVSNNEIFGLLGPNGAGKTTTLRCISTLLAPTRGSITVNDFNTVAHAKSVRQNICFLTNEIKLDDHFSPNYLIHFFGKLHGMNDQQLSERKTTLFNKLGIWEFKDKKISKLSTGMKQKASIAISLIHDPSVIIFDEPTNGLDIITAKTVTDYLLELRAEGKTIILSTHIMDVASKLCDRIAVIINGSIHLTGSLEEILTHTKTNNLEEAFFQLYNKAVESC